MFCSNQPGSQPTVNRPLMRARGWPERRARAQGSVGRDSYIRVHTHVGCWVRALRTLMDPVRKATKRSGAQEKISLGAGPGPSARSGGPPRSESTVPELMLAAPSWGLAPPV